MLLPPSFLYIFPNKHIVFIRDIGKMFGDESDWIPVPKIVSVLKSLHYPLLCSLLDSLAAQVLQIPFGFFKKLLGSLCCEPWAKLMEFGVVLVGFAHFS